MIDAIIRKKLLADPTVSGLVSTRVYIDDLPVPAVLPAITVHPTSAVPSSEAKGGCMTRIQVSCWAEAGTPKDPETVESVSAAVKAVLDKARMNMAPELWTVGSYRFSVTSRHVTGGVRLIDPVTGWYHVPVDVLITYHEV